MVELVAEQVSRRDNVTVGETEITPHFIGEIAWANLADARPAPEKTKNRERGVMPFADRRCKGGGHGAFLPAVN